MASLSADEVAPLTLLLKAQSKSVVVNVCREGFAHRNGKVPDMVLASIAKTLDIQPLEARKEIIEGNRYDSYLHVHVMAEQRSLEFAAGPPRTSLLSAYFLPVEVQVYALSNVLFHALSSLVKAVLFEGLSDSESIAELFPVNFHENLKGLLSDTLARNVTDWKANALKDQVSLPRLVDFDWRVDVKTSSDSVARMAQPTCLVQMTIEDTPTHQDQMPPTKSINVEFSRETLDTMLDGLGKIRDQLSSVAKSS